MIANKYLLACWLVATAACGPPAERGLNVNATPQWTVRGRDLVVVTFDRPMVDASRIGQALAKTPLRIIPAVPGQARWSDDRTLTFEPAAAWPLARRFEVEIPRGIRARDGKRIEEAIRFSFESQRLSGDARLSGVGADYPEVASTMQPVTVAFSQPVVFAEIARACAYSAGSRKIGLRRADRKASDPALATKVLPRQRLTANTDWSFRCETSLRGTVGNLGLDRPVTLDFHTHGAFRVEQLSPRGDSVDPHHARIELQTSTWVRQPDALPLKITPEVKGLRWKCSVSKPQYTRKRKLSCDLRLAPQTTYTVAVDRKLRDVFGQTLAEPASTTFRTGDAAPSVELDRGLWVVQASEPAFPLWTINIRQLRVDVARIGEAAVPTLLGQIDWLSDRGFDLTPFKIKSVERTLDLTPRYNHWDAQLIEPARLAGHGRSRGIYMITARAPEAARPEKPAPVELAIVNITDLGLVTKLADDSGLVWVTRLSNGKPVAGARVTIIDDHGNERWHGRTRHDGTIATPGLLTLTAPLPVTQTKTQTSAKKTQASAPPAAESDASQPPSELFVFVRTAGDVTFVNLRSDGQLARTGVVSSISGTADQMEQRGVMRSDRRSYRPGDTVRISGLIGATPRAGSVVAGHATAHLAVYDPNQGLVTERDVPVSRFGGFALEIPLASGAETGDYRVNATLGQQALSADFRVRSRHSDAPSAQADRSGVILNGRSERPFYTPGQQLHAYLRASGVHKGVAGAPVSWRMRSRPRIQRFAMHSGYAFQDTRRWEGTSRATETSAVLAKQQTRLDQNSRATAAFTVPTKAIEEPVDLVLDARLGDKRTGRSKTEVVVPIHPASIYLGIDPQARMVEAGKKHVVRLLAVDLRGTPVRAKADFRVMQRAWSCAERGSGPSGISRCAKTERQIMQQSLELTAKGPTEVEITLPESGEYWLIAEGRDLQKRSAVAAHKIFAWGQGVGAWHTAEGHRFAVVSDKASYKPGERARLLLMAPVAAARGLMTIERHGVIDRLPISIRGGQTSVLVPIKASYGPTAFVSMILMQPGTAGSSGNSSLVYTGKTTLDIETDEHRLQVAIDLNRTNERRELKAQVHVTNGVGPSNAADVAIAISPDEAIPPSWFGRDQALAALQAAWGRGSATATQIDRLMVPPRPGTERPVGSAKTPPPLSSTEASALASTLCWHAALTTDIQGYVDTTCVVSDTARHLRAIAVAVDGEADFGRGEAQNESKGTTPAQR